MNDSTVSSHCSYYLGQKPGVYITDLEILKHVMVKDFEAFMDRPVRLHSYCVVAGLCVAFDYTYHIFF